MRARQVAAATSGFLVRAVRWLACPLVRAVRWLDRQLAPCAPGLILSVTMLHLWWGACLLVEPAALWITALAKFSPIGHVAAGLLMLVASIAAICGLLRMQGGLSGFLLGLPQQILILLSATSALLAIIRSTFADGVERPQGFIAADQGDIALLALAHTWALSTLHVRSRCPQRCSTLIP